MFLEDEWEYRRQYRELLQDYEERREEVYSTENLYVGLEGGKITLRDERSYFPEHLYREAIHGYESIINEAPIHDMEKSVECLDTGGVESKTKGESL